jgi:hypothetical protein
MRIAVEIWFLSRLQAEMAISASAAAIVNFPLPVWSYSIQSVSIRFLDLENGEVAVDILFLCAIEAEIRWVFFTP